MKSIAVLKIGAAMALGITLGGAGCFVVLDPRHWADRTQSVILAHVVAEFCHPMPWSPERYAGRTNAIASVAVAAGLGPLAAAEVARCEAQNWQESAWGQLHPDDFEATLWNDSNRASQGMPPATGQDLARLTVAQPDAP